MSTANSSNAQKQKVDSILAIIKSYQQPMPLDRVPGDNADADAGVSSEPELEQGANSEEVARQIRQRVSGMQLQIESASVQIELLHGLRASEEANHSTAKKSLRDKWKQVVKHEEANHDGNQCKQTKINENLTKQHKALMKEELSLKLALERVITMERDTCNKLQEDGAKELAKAKANWLYSEKNEFRKREQKLIPKIKREAAKMVELKLRKLSEKHSDEIRSLERETAREVESYKLELYRNSQKICKNERRKVEAAEKRFRDSVEQEWTTTLEDTRAETHKEMTAQKQAHDETMEAHRAKHEMDKKRRLDQHEMDLKEAKILLEASLAQQRLSKDFKLKSLQHKLDEEITLRKAKMQK